MNLLRTAIAAGLGLSVTLPATALSSPMQRQTGVAITPGMAIVDEAGNPVGHVESLQGDDLLVRTDLHQARIPRSSFRLRLGRLVLNMTQAQVDAAVDRLAPPPPAQVVPGALVRGAGGIVAGTIESVEGDYVVIRLTSGDRVSLAGSSVGATDQGATISLTTEELRRRVAEASAGASN